VQSVDGYRIDWSNVAYPTGATQFTSTITRFSDGSDPIPWGVFIIGNTDRSLGGFPVSTDLFQGGLNDDSLALAYDFAANNELIRVIIDLSTPVENVSLSIFDIDSLDATNGVGGFRDSVTVRGFDGAFINANLSVPAAGSFVSITDPNLPPSSAIGGGGNAANASNLGNLDVTFDVPTRYVVVDYSNAFNPPSANPAPQGIGIHDISFCIPRSAALEAEKTLTIHRENNVDCGVIPGTGDPEAEAAIPGACMEYVITVENLGPGFADEIALTDVLDDNLIFAGAAVSGFAFSGPGSGLIAPSAGTDCAGSACSVAISGGELAEGATGTITVRTEIK